MSQHIFKTTASSGQAVTVIMGYDRPLDFVFCTIADENGENLYSNLSDPDAGTSQQNVAYYCRILESHGIQVPEDIFDAVEYDQLNKVGNRVVNHSQED